jgi:hypothetical protein
MSTKYIQNTYTADIQIITKVDGRQRNYIFAHYQRDKISGQVISDGFTEVTEDDLKVLNTNGAFKLLIDKKRLILKDEAPLKAGSFEQLLDLKAKVKEQAEIIEALRAEIAELKGEKGGADDGLDKLKLDELKAKAKELGLDAESLKKKDEVIKLIREANGKAGE